MAQQAQTKPLPSGWKREKLGDVVKMGSGGTPLRSHSEYYGGKIKWTVTEDLNEGVLCDTKTKITKEGLENSSAKLVPEKTLLIAMYGSIGKTAITGCEMATNQAIAFVLPQNKLDLNYLKYFLNLSIGELIFRSHGGVQSNISQEILKKFEISYPESKQEQSQIVSEIETQFTRLDESVKSLKSVKQKLEVYRKAVLKEAFEKKEGWEEKKIIDNFIINPPKTEIKDLDESLEVSFIPMAYVSEAGKIERMDKRAIKDVKKGFTFFREGDVLLAKITPCFENGKKALAENLLNGIGFGTTEFYVFRTKEEVLPKWIYYTISREDFRSGAKRSMGGAVGQQRVSKDFIENFKITYPKSVKEQSQIVQSIEDKFSVIDKLEQIVDVSLEKAEKLRKSILKSAFEGKLVKIEEVQK